jgi:hypothetical protein
MKKTLITIALALLAACMLTCCAQLEAQYCNPNAAYAEGVNAAQAHQPMDSNYASICPRVQAPKINAAYRKGYMSTLRTRPAKPAVVAVVPPARRDAEWQCIDLPFKSVCGYGCIKTPFNEVYCGARPGDRCVKDKGYS